MNNLSLNVNDHNNVIVKLDILQSGVHNNTDTCKKKYLKYKGKYITLKSKDIIGGGITWRNLLKMWSDKEEYNIEFPDYSFAIKFYPFNGNMLDTMVEYKILRQDSLAKEQDYTSFNKKFPTDKSCDVISFKNLSGDTSLIVPCPDVGKNYAHIKLFNKNASDSKKKELWKKVAEEITNIINNDKDQEIYLNTHGHGVPYLHVRVDLTPKYGYDFLN